MNCISSKSAWILTFSIYREISAVFPTFSGPKTTIRNGSSRLASISINFLSSSFQTSLKYFVCFVLFCWSFFTTPINTHIHPKHSYIHHVHHSPYSFKIPQKKKNNKSSSRQNCNRISLEFLGKRNSVRQLIFIIFISIFIIDFKQFRLFNQKTKTNETRHNERKENVENEWKKQQNK